jgi:hypothetical protein
MTTQAGATEDEDFPGLAALVTPTGVVARLPDWRPGSLVVEVPLPGPGGQGVLLGDPVDLGHGSGRAVLG